MIHPESCECTPSASSFFERPPTQTGVLQRTTVECLPVAEVNASGPIEFYVPASDEDVYDLRGHRFEVTIKVTKADGSDLEADDKVSVVNYTLHSLFSQCDIWINEQLVSHQSNTYSYKALIEALLTYTSADKKSQLALSLFEKDKGNSMDDVAGAGNPGFVERKKKIAVSRLLTLRGCLHNEFLRQPKYLLSHCSLRIRLTPQPKDFVLMTQTSDDFALHIVSARFEVPKLKLNPSKVLEDARFLKTTPAIYSLRQGNIKTFSVATGSLSVTKENLFTSKPRRVIIGFVSAAAFNGASTKNPFNFENLNVTYLSLYVDGERVPSRPLTPDFSKSSYAREYDLLLQTTGHWDQETALDIKPFEFSNGHTLFGIPLTAGDVDTIAVEPHRNASIRLEVKFKNALAASYIVIVYADMDNSLEIDHNRMITMEH